MNTPPKPLILIVDDDNSIRSLLKLAIKNKGYRVEEATNGEECLSVYQRCQPDLVLLDAIMPVMDGFTCCRRLCQLAQDKEIPILMLTFLDDQDSIDQAFEAGATDYITKPIHWAVLFQRVKRLLTASQNSLNAQKISSELNYLQSYQQLLHFIIAEKPQINEDLLSKIRLFFAVDRVIFSDLITKTIMESVSENYVEITSNNFDDLLLLNDKNIKAQYLKEEPLSINKLSTAKIEPNIRKYLEELQIQSLAIAPFVNNKKLNGLLGIYACQNQHFWNDLELEKLSILGKLLLFISQN
jgi:CheY-like chemotaxis protein